MEDSTQIIDEPFKAVENGNLSLLKVLMLNGIDVQIQDKDGATLLHHAANYDQLEIIKFLIEKGIGLTQVNKIGKTVLHIVASKNHLHIANVLFQSVNYDESRKLINAKTTTTGTTALHIASKNGFHNMALLLLNYGATYNIKNKNGKRPIDVTKDQAIIGLLKQVKLNFEQAKAGEEKLYERLEKSSIDKFSAFMNACNNEGYNIVEIAIVNCHANVATLLQCLKVVLFRRHGHRPTFKNKYFDELLLLATNTLTKLQDNNCTQEICLKYVHQFVSTFRSFDKFISDPNILAIEDMLRLSCHRDAISFMEHTKQVIEVHLKLFSASIYSIKLLESTRCKNWTLAEKCMAQMAFVNLSDEGGWTPLLHAINAGNEKIVKMLIDHGARVNCSTKIGKNTSLHIAVNNGHFEIVQLLLERENNSEFVNAKTAVKGSTALHIAAKSGHFDIVLWLLKCRAIYCVKNNDDKMPMDLINEESHQMFFKLIGESFDQVKNGKVEIIHKLESLTDDEFLAVVLCQNEDGCLLKDVALQNKHDEIANHITDKFKVILSGKGFNFNED